MALPIRRIGNPEPISESVYNVLVTHAGADEAGREKFLKAWIEELPIPFPSPLGDTARLAHHNKRLYVTIPEGDMSPNRLAVQKKVNELLALMEGVNDY